MSPCSLRPLAPTDLVFNVELQFCQNTQQLIIASSGVDHRLSPVRVSEELAIHKLDDLIPELRDRGAAHLIMERLARSLLLPKPGSLSFCQFGQSLDALRGKLGVQQSNCLSHLPHPSVAHFNNAMGTGQKSSSITKPIITSLPKFPAQKS